MIEQLSNAIKFIGFFVASRVGKTGLTVTADIYNPAGTKIVTDGAVTEIGGGLYQYTLASGSVTTEGEYQAVFKTSDATVDQAQIPALWVIGRAGVEDLDAAITSRLAPTTASRTLDVTATGAAGIDWANVENPTTAVNLSATNIDTDQVVASVTGAVGSVGAGGITATSIAADAIGASEIATDAITEIQSGLALEATLTAIKGTGWASTESLKAIDTMLDAIKAKIDDISAAIVGVTAGTTLEIRVAVQYSESLDDLGSVANRTKCWFTVKEQLGDTDAEAIIQIEETGGLLYLNGAAYATAAHGSLSWTDTANGDVTITLADDAAALLTAARSLYYDIQVLEPTGKRLVTEGRLHITGTATHAVT